MLAGPQAPATTDTPSSLLLTLLDHPETNVSCPNTEASAGVLCAPATPPYHPRVLESCELDPLADHTGMSHFRHSGWANDRRRVYDALRLTHVGSSRLQAFRECGQHPFVYECEERPGEYTLGGSTCRDRFCLPCSRDRSRLIAQNVLEQIGTRQGRFVTLTLKSTAEPLDVLLARLTSSFTKLRRTKLWRNKVVGGVAFIEVTWTCRTQSWHPHFHCLVEGRYLPRRELSQAWHLITGDSYITDIRFARDNAHVTHYITKYATKPLDHSVLVEPTHLQEAILALKGKRLCLTFGTWRGVCLTRSREDETWIQIGSLAELLHKATQNDPAAQVILRKLEIPFVTEPRGPPSRTATAVRGLVPRQYMLNLSAAFGNRWDVN